MNDLLHAVKTLDGHVMYLPYADEIPCFGRRQGWCINLATWRMRTPHLMLHWCDSCKERENVLGFKDAVWTKLPLATAGSGSTGVEASPGKEDADA